MYEPVIFEKPIPVSKISNLVFVLVFFYLIFKSQLHLHLSINKVKLSVKDL